MPNRAVVLVVEDEVLVRMMLADVLDEAGFRVVEAAHADEALRVLAARNDVETRVTDVEMPAGSMNGYRLAQQVKQAYPALQIVVVSGREGPGLGDLPDRAAFLAKPVHPETLVRLLRSLVSQPPSRPQAAHDGEASANGSS